MRIINGLPPRHFSVPPPAKSRHPVPPLTISPLTASLHGPTSRQAALDQLFLDAHTHNKWQAKDVADSLLERLLDVIKMGPTSANCSPARILFIKSRAAKNRLEPYLSDGNRTKTMAAPVTAIIGHDLAFYEHLPRL